MSRYRQPKIGAEPLRLTGKRGFSRPKEKQQPGDLSKSTLHTRSINLGKPDSMPAYPAGPIKKMPSG